MLHGLAWGPAVPPQLNKQRGENNNEHGNEDDDGGAVDERDILGEVQLAQKLSASLFFSLFFKIIHVITVPKIPRNISLLAYHLGISSLPALISRFLYSQENPELDVPLNEIPLNQCPQYTGKVMVYASAVATYNAPSDVHGVSGLFHE